MSDQEGQQSRKKPKSRTVSVNTLELYSFLVSQQRSVSPGAVFETLLHFGLEVGDEEEAMAHLAEEAKKFKINSSTKLNKLLKKLNPTLCLEEQAEEDDGVVQSEDEVSNESTSGEGDAAQRAAAVGPNQFPAQFGPGAESLQNGDDESEDEESNESTSGEGDAAQVVEPNQIDAQFGVVEVPRQNGGNEGHNQDQVPPEIAGLMDEVNFFLDDLDDPQSYLDSNSNNIFDDFLK